MIVGPARPRAARPSPPRSTPPEGFRVLVDRRRRVGPLRGLQPPAKPACPSRWSRGAARSAAPGVTTTTPGRGSTRRTTSTPSRSPPTTGRCTSPSATSCMPTWSTSPTEFDLRRSIRFGTTVESADMGRRSAVLVRAPYAPTDGDHEVLTASAVISGVGIFNPIKFPDIDGLDTFAGPCFHTAQWPDDLDLHGRARRDHRDRRQRHAGGAGDPARRRVAHHLPALAALGRPLRAVPQGGTTGLADAHAGGAAVPCLVPRPARLDVQRPHPPDAAEGPRLAARRAIPERHERRPPPRTSPSTSYAELGERTDLLDQVVPTYPPFGKRMLMDNGWFRMLRNPKVTLVTDPVAATSSPTAS